MASSYWSLFVAHRRVPEKTLELNVCENLINMLRDRYPKAFLYGFSLRTEGRYGLDTNVILPGGTHILCLQFKSPIRRYDSRYVFEINNNRPNYDQHFKILGTASRILSAGAPVLYAFPAIASMREMYTYSPRFLNRTFFVEPFVLTPPIRRRGNRHRVVLDTQRLVLTVRSEERTVRVLTWEDVFYRLRERKIGFKFEDIWKSKENREYRPEFHDVLEAIDKDTRDFILKGGYRQSYRALCIPSQ